MTSTAALANAPKTFRQRDAWMRNVLSADLPHIAVRLAIRIALHLHVDTGRCDPTFPTLAAETRIGERSIYRLVALLERAGWIGIQRTRGRHANQYVLLNPDSILAGLNPDSTLAGLDTANPAKIDSSTLPKSQMNPANRVAGKKRKRKAKEKSGGSKSLAPGVAAPNSEPVSAEQAEPQKSPVSGKPKADLGARFDEFWAAYPRRVAKLAAEKAFAGAVERGADAADLIAGAKRYAAERAGQEPRYTKHPATWLNAGGWMDEPPPGAGPPTIDQDGNEVAQPAPRPSRHNMSFEEAAEELLAEPSEW